MDNQGFVVSGQTAEKGAKTVQQIHAAATKAAVPVAAANINPMRRGLNDAVGALRPTAKDEVTDHRIQKLRKVQGRADMLWTAEFGGMIGGGALGWVATKTKSDKFAAVVKAIFVSPFDALRGTKLNEIHTLPANYMKSFSKHADAIGGNAKSWAQSAEKRAASLEASGVQFAEQVRSTTAPVTAPLRNGVRSGLQSFESTAMGGSVTGGLQKVMNWRMNANQNAHLKHLEKAETALTQEVPGFFKKITNFFTGKKPAILPAHESLAEVTEHLAKARGATTSADRMLHMESAQTALKDLAFKAEGDLAKRVGNIGKYIEKSGSAATVAHNFETSAAKGLPGMLKSMGKAIGRVPVFGAVIAVGVAAGVTATAMSHKKEAKQASAARTELAAVIGTDNPLMQTIDQAYKKDKSGRVVKTGLSMVGDLANGAMGISVHGGGMAVMGAAMLPMLGNILVKDNPLLNCYANLRLEETQGVKLDPATKLMMIRQLVASLPDVAKAGGLYNRLTLPVAEAIMDKNLTAQQTMQLLANGPAFSKLASDVQAEQKAAAEAMPANAPEAVAKTAEMPNPMIAANTAISASSVAHQGRVAELHKAASV